MSSSRDPERFESRPLTPTTVRPTKINLARGVLSRESSTNVPPKATVVSNGARNAKARLNGAL